jgi:hypothetical protein
LPGKKQVFRICNKQGQLRKTSSLRRKLVGPNPVKEGSNERKDHGIPSFSEEIRSVFLSEFAKLPEPIKAIRNAAHYLVEHSSNCRNTAPMSNNK